VLAFATFLTPVLAFATFLTPVLAFAAFLAPVLALAAFLTPVLAFATLFTPVFSFAALLTTVELHLLNKLRSLDYMANHSAIDDRRGRHAADAGNPCAGCKEQDHKG
jgi:hypothetical protein